MESLRLVDGRGEVREISSGDELLAARVGLGALGIVTELTLRAVPLFTLRRRDEPRPLGETLEAMDGLVEGTDHWEFWVFPYSDVALVRSSTRSDEPPEAVDERKLWLQEYVLENAVVGAFARTGRAFPAPDPVPQRHAAQAGVAHDEGGPVVEGVRHAPRGPLHRDGVRHPARARARGGARR